MQKFKKFQKLSRAAMKNVKGGGDTGCKPLGCNIVVGGDIYPGTCSVGCTCLPDLFGGPTGPCYQNV